MGNGQDLTGPVPESASSCPALHSPAAVAPTEELLHLPLYHQPGSQSSAFVSCLWLPGTGRDACRYSRAFSAWNKQAVSIPVLACPGSSGIDGCQSHYLRMGGRGGRELL